LIFNQKNLIMFIFHYKKGIRNLKLTVKTMEKGNFKLVFLGTMILHLQTY
jgi:hypothetical protein